MFREMRRFKQQVEEKECCALLKKEMRGVLAVNGDDGYPYAFPIDYCYEETSSAIYFHCAKEGHKLDALRKSDKVSFCVYNSGWQKPDDWALYITSVIVFGRMHVVDEEEEAKKGLQAIGKKYMPPEEEAEIDYDAQLKRVCMLRLDIEHMTGKLVHEK